MCRIARIGRRTTTVLDSVVQRLRGAEDGFAMAMVVFIVVIISLLGIAMLTVAAYQMKDSDRTLPSNRAFDLADSGLSYAHGYLAQDNTIPNPTDTPSYYDSTSLQMGDSNSTFDVTIAKATTNGTTVIPSQYVITSTGTYRQNEGTSGNPSYRTYARKLQETVQYRGTSNNLDCFNYLLYSDKGDVTLDTGRGYFSGASVTYNGDIYAGRNAYLYDKKDVVGVGYLNVLGDVTAGNDADLESQTKIIAGASDQASGDVTAGHDVTVNSAAFVASGANFLVGGSINAGNNVNLSATNTALALASTSVAQRAGTSVNAGGNVNINSSLVALAGTDVEVGNSGAPSNVNANGNFNMSANATIIGIFPGAKANVWGSVQAKGQANQSSNCGFLSSAASNVNHSMKCNGNSTLATSGLGSATCNVGSASGDVWQMGGIPSSNGGCSWQSKVNSNPNVGNAPVVPVPNEQLPEPNWNWYKTMAIAQGHYYSGDQNLSSINISGDPSSMWVLYVAGNLTLTDVNFQNVNVNGVIVCEGNFTVNGNVNWKNSTQYQVIAKGDITHANGGTTYNAVNDTVFLYTDGSCPGSNGNITFDLAWFNHVKGQMTAKGNITSAAGQAFITSPEIDYQAPTVAAAAWPNSFDVLSFREL